MTKTTTLTVRLNGVLGDHVADTVGEHGSFENVSEYIRHLIRCDKERAEAQAFSRLKAELDHAFSAPEERYHPLSADQVIARNRA
ncbi:ribbon-helix-helix domain-containing protein [Woodsholea maritima]|uniref:ribbon-helix-helix domain-containing protein n=1 Tax=Woodsholea maritima TaxID=240237 RepID=UPI0003656DF2|nr:hypothetical protein [Woodsholea maritima]